MKSAKEMWASLNDWVDNKSEVLRANPKSALDPYKDINYKVNGVKENDRMVIVFDLINNEREANGKKQVYNKVSFSFPMNPTTVKTTLTKLGSTVLTEGGFVTTHWGNGITNLRLEANTGNLDPILDLNDSERLAEAVNRENPYLKGSVLGNAMNTGLNNLLPGTVVNEQGQRTIFTSKAYNMFCKLKYFFQFFNGGNEVGWDAAAPVELRSDPRQARTYLHVFNTLYIGRITTFDFGLDAQSPFTIDYSLDFECLPTLDPVGKKTQLDIPEHQDIDGQ